MTTHRHIAQLIVVGIVASQLAQASTNVAPDFVATRLWVCHNGPASSPAEDAQYTIWDIHTGQKMMSIFSGMQIGTVMSLGSNEPPYYVTETTNSLIVLTTSLGKKATMEVLPLEQWWKTEKEIRKQRIEPGH